MKSCQKLEFFELYLYLGQYKIIHKHKFYRGTLSTDIWFVLDLKLENTYAIIESQKINYHNLNIFINKYINIDRCNGVDEFSKLTYKFTHLENLIQREYLTRGHSSDSFSQFVFSAFDFFLPDKKEEAVINVPFRVEF